ncbi:MAG TPA: hypothetical protein VF867_09990 [Arthrobacter sp.]
MTTNVQQTSVLAYKSLTLSDRQTEVRRAISSLGTACNQQIADYLHLPVNQVTGRVFELRAMGVVISSHKAVWAPTGKTVIFWQIALGTPAVATVTSPS